MKRGKRPLAAVCAAVFSMLSVFAAYGDETTFVRGTRINGTNVGDMTVESGEMLCRIPISISWRSS